MELKPNTKYYIPNKQDRVKFQEECFKQGIYWRSGSKVSIDNLGPWFAVRVTDCIVCLWWSSNDHFSDCEFIASSTLKENNHPKPERVIVQAYGYNLPTLTEEQIKWLHDVMQNPIWGQKPDEEDWDDRQMRKFFFEVTSIKNVEEGVNNG